MVKNYKEFTDRFERSGLSQRAFAELEGISPSMVSYYVRKSRSEDSKSESKSKTDKFIPLQVKPPVEKHRKLSIHLPDGTLVEIPI